MTSLNLQKARDELRAQHEGWLQHKYTSKGQREDSQTIIALLDYVDVLCNPSDGRCMDIVSMRIRNEELTKRVSELELMTGFLPPGTTISWGHQGDCLPGCNCWVALKERKEK